ncbi:hypothetical protein Salat_1456000 [Sesamum alatum]|uniref:Uncharacterized protein n=1 Tax=Sesamum alatum TaxID=300844 RepID=A0AAE2CLS8_9LAMI|nr:hypothetical protein Salat_1456000 [Sesamum alatum]
MGAPLLAVPSLEEVHALNRLLSEFNLSEFLALANRVIDEGDLASMEAISDLKRRWTEKFGAFQSRPSMVARPSSSRTLAPFRSITAPTRPARRIPRMPTTEQMNVYLQHTPSVAASFPIPLLSLPPSSMASSSLFPVSAAAENLAPPSIVAVLEGSQQDPDNQPPSFQSEPPSIRVDNQPQTSLHVEPPSFLSDPPSIRVDNQPQSSLFSMDTHIEGNLHNLPAVAPLTRPPSSAPLDKGNASKPPEIFIGVYPPALSVEIPSEESALPTAAGREVLNPACERWTNQTKEELEGQAEHVDSL